MVSGVQSLLNLLSGELASAFDHQLVYGTLHRNLLRVSFRNREIGPVVARGLEHLGAVGRQAHLSGLLHFLYARLRLL